MGIDMVNQLDVATDTLLIGEDSHTQALVLKQFLTDNGFDAICVEVADRCLYQAKDQGRNCCCQADVVK